MATLNHAFPWDGGDVSLHNFCPEDGRELRRQYEVDGGRHILVEELQGSSICYTFFKADTLQRIPPEERYVAENGREEHQLLGDGYSSIARVEVNADTGFEGVSEQLFKDGELVYDQDRPRYNEDNPSSLLDDYKHDLELDKEIEDATEAYLQEFYNADFEQKVRILNTDFVRNSTDNYVMGIEPAELFLSKEQFDDLDKDKDFRRALRASMDMQADNSDMPAQEIYDLIIRTYASD